MQSAKSVFRGLPAKCSSLDIRFCLSTCSIEIASEAFSVCIFIDLSEINKIQTT